MRTTLNLDRDLLERAKASLGVATYTEAIELSLARAIAQAEVDRLLDSVSGSDLVWSVEELQEYRRTGRGDAS
ncbi:MAG TPA: type II toxin-antitoxin system VapB family antitoxin [Longimicrobiales bacterium]|nr:type II toxin-antitoxin system VapB family antitoxin [Longimicrobiales bacterium]